MKQKQADALELLDYESRGVFVDVWRITQAFYFEDDKKMSITYYVDDEDVTVNYTGVEREYWERFVESLKAKGRTFQKAEGLEFFDLERAKKESRSKDFSEDMV